MPIPSSHVRICAIGLARSSPSRWISTMCMAGSPSYPNPTATMMLRDCDFFVTVKQNLGPQPLKLIGFKPAIPGAKPCHRARLLARLAEARGGPDRDVTPQHHRPLAQFPPGTARTDQPHHWPSELICRTDNVAIIVSRYRLWPISN